MVEKGDGTMTGKTTEMIDEEIQKVMNQFECVEDIIGRLADEGGRNYLVHRELRSFTWFVTYMIFAKEEELSDEFDLKFKKEYGNFCLNSDGDSAYDLYKWACLYWIYNKKWEETDEYKELEEMV